MSLLWWGVVLGDLGEAAAVGSWDKGLGLQEEECDVGTPDLLTPPSNSILTPEKGQCDRTSICNADHVQEEGKKKQESMVLYQSADC